MKRKLFIQIVILLLSCNLINAKWEQISWLWNGFPEGSSFVSSITVDKKIPNNIFCSVNGYLYYSTNNGDNWEKLKGYKKVGNESVFNILVSYPLILVSANAQSKFFISNDYGDTWREIDSLCQKSYSGHILCSFNYWMFNIYNDTLFVGTDYGLFMSIDSGYNWIPLFKGNIWDNGAFSMIKRNDTLLIGSGTGIYMTTDFGDSWIEKNNGLEPLTDSQFLLDLDNVILLWIPYRYEGKILASTNIGENWDVYIDLKDTITYFAYKCGNNLFSTSGKYGFLYSYNKGKNWKFYNDGLPYYNNNYGFNINYITFNDNFIYCISGIWSETEMKIYRAHLLNCEIVGATDVPESSEQGVETPCSIYPNPATERVFIELGVWSWEFGVGEIGVYDVFGERIISLYPQVDSKEGIELDVSGLPQGMYYLVVKTGGNTLTKQFAVVR